MKQMIWSGQGPIYFGTYDPSAGTPEMGFMRNIFRVGCANRTLTTTPGRETRNIKETCSGQRLDIAELETSKSLQVRIDMAQFDREVLARALFAVSTLKDEGSATDETLPELAAGDYFFLRHTDASEVVLTDSKMDGETPDPQTLVAGTHYTMVDAAQGVGQIISVDGVEQPIKVAYSHGAYGNIAAFTQTSAQTGVIFTGRNQDGDKARVMIPRVSLSLQGDFSWISDEESVLQLQGPAFYVPELDTEGSDFGPFMRVSGLPD